MLSAAVGITSNLFFIVLVFVLSWWHLHQPNGNEKEFLYSTVRDEDVPQLRLKRKNAFTLRGEHDGIINLKFVTILECEIFGNRIFNELLRFQILPMASMEMTTVWDIVLCSLVEVDVSGVCTALAIEATHTTPETLIFFSNITRCYSPEGCHLL
jgi:hypothetical protein